MVRLSDFVNLHFNSNDCPNFTLTEAEENNSWLNYEFPPVKGKRVPMGDVFTSCNWALRDGCVACGSVTEAELLKTRL